MKSVAANVLASLAEATAAVGTMKQEIKETVDVFDAGGSGEIDSEGLQEHVQKMLLDMGNDGSGTIGCEKVTMMTRKVVVLPVDHVSAGMLENDEVIASNDPNDEIPGPISDETGTACYGKLA